MRGRPLLVVVGPTASGKTELVEQLAASIPIEAVAADAMQVYKGMDIGTAKPTDSSVAYHLVDVVEPTESFSAALYQELAVAAIDEIRARQRLPVLVGGTGLYVRAVVDGLDFAPGDPEGDLRRRLTERAEREGGEALHAELLALDPEAAERIDPANTRRVIRALEWLEAGETPSERHRRFAQRRQQQGTVMVGLDVPRDVLRERIAERVDRMFEAGLEDEVRGLWEGQRLGRTALQAIGYKELLAYFNGASTRADAVDRVVTRTRQYAKRQLTWFGRDERVTWVDGMDIDSATRVVADLVRTGSS